MAGEVKLSISGRPLPPIPEKVTREELVYPDDPEGGPDCIDVLPDGRHVAWCGTDTWYEVDPVTTEPNYDQPLDPESIPASLRENQPAPE